MRFIASFALLLAAATGANAQNAADYVGSWEVVSKAFASTCKDFQEGDAVSSEWRISAKGGKLIIETNGSEGVPTSLKGEVTSYGIEVLPDAFKEDKHKIRLRLVGEKLIGGRLSSYKGIQSCATFFELTLRRR